MLSKGGDYNLSMEPQSDTTERRKEARGPSFTHQNWKRCRTIIQSMKMKNIFTHQAIVLLVPDGSRCGTLAAVKETA